VIFRTRSGAESGLCDFGPLTIFRSLARRIIPGFAAFSVVLGGTHRDNLDLVEPAYITFDDKDYGEFAFGCANGGLDCEYTQRTIFFTWQGFDEMDEVGGNGSTDLNDDGTLDVEIRFYLGDVAILKARKW
jgi:hypothetical protein